MQIAGRQIDAANPTIIAELGVNHDGSVERALELTEAAARAGADAIKLQYFRTDLLMSRAAKLAAYQRSAGESDPVSMLRRLELTLDDMAPIVARAHELGVHAIVTVFSVELVEEAETLSFDAYKTASPDLIHKPLLEALAATGKPLIVSTGAAEYDEVKRARLWLDSAQDRLALLHCISCYPTRPEDAHLCMIAHVMMAGAGAPVGYSDHTTLLTTGVHAVRGFGASMLEKHLTYDRSARGPDHAASLEPAQFEEYVRLSRAPSLRGSADARLLGDAVKHVVDCERDVRAVSRQSITTTRALAPGETLDWADLTFKRPGTGIEPFHVEDVIGRVVARAVEADAPLTWEDVA